MGIFAKYMQVKLNEMDNTILTHLDQKHQQGQMPYDAIHTDESLTKNLGLTPDQINSMKQNGALTRTQGGFQIDKSKFQQYPQMGTAPPVPQPKQYPAYPQGNTGNTGVPPQVNQAGTTPAIQGLRPPQ